MNTKNIVLILAWVAVGWFVYDLLREMREMRAALAAAENRMALLETRSVEKRASVPWALWGIQLVVNLFRLFR